MRPRERSWSELSLVVVVVAGAALVGAGCLFPSFDELIGPARSDETSGKSDKDKDSGKGSTDPDDPSDPRDPSDPDGGLRPDGGGPSGSRTVACGSKTCDITVGEYCCTSFGEAECNTPSDIMFCQAVIRCDGNQDCPDGQVCCVPNLGNESACRADCGGNGRVVCQPEAPRCPANQTCTGEEDLGGTTGFFCR